MLTVAAAKDLPYPYPKDSYSKISGKGQRTEEFTTLPNATSLDNSIYWKSQGGVGEEYVMEGIPV